MKNIIYQLSWWKYLCVLIILYVLIAGIIIPLKPGIYYFAPTQVTEGEEVTIGLIGYNTHFNSGGDTRVWIKFPNNKLLKATDVKIESETVLNAKFDIPIGLDIDSGSGILTTLIVDNNNDGFAIYPQGFRIKKAINRDNHAANSEMFFDLSEIRQVNKIEFPFRNILYETIRNTFFHVAIWFAMFLLLIISCYHSIRYLRFKDQRDDLKSNSYTTVAICFGIAGILTGSMWAKFTWGTFWTSDVKLNMSAIALLIYIAYLILRKSISDIDARARICAVYNIFAFICLMLLVMVIPRLTDSLHPGNGGNPALGGEDLDNTLRMVFYPAIIGYTLLGMWMAELYFRFIRLEDNVKIIE